MMNVFAPPMTSLVRQGRIDDAVELARANVSAHPGNGAALSALAHALLAKGNVAEADQVASEAVSAAVGEPAFHFLAARIKFELQDFHSAADHAGQAFNLSTQAGSLYYQESSALLAAAAFASMGEIEQAMGALQVVGEDCVVLAGSRLTRSSVLEFVRRYSDRPSR